MKPKHNKLQVSNVFNLLTALLGQFIYNLQLSLSEEPKTNKLNLFSLKASAL